MLLAGSLLLPLSLLSLMNKILKTKKKKTKTTQERIVLATNVAGMMECPYTREKS